MTEFMSLEQATKYLGFKSQKSLKNYIREGLPVIMIGVNDLVYGFIMYILCGLLNNHLKIFYYIRSTILPEVVYTVAVGLVMYQILLRINDWLDKNEKGSADFV